MKTYSPAVLVDCDQYSYDYSVQSALKLIIKGCV